jgi:hypothetical protein
VNVKTTRLLLLNTVLAVLMHPASTAAQDADQLAKQTQNPVASLISVPLQGNCDFGLGDGEASSTLLNVQPVIPFGVSKSTNLILRVIMPLTSQPVSDGSRISGPRGRWRSRDNGRLGCSRTTSGRSAAPTIAAR